AGPKPDKVSAAQAKLDQALANLQQVQATASVNKNKAEQDVTVAANAVRAAQDTLSKTYWDTHAGDGSWRKAPSDRGYQDDIDNYNKAVRDEQDAQAKLEQARLALESTKAQEATNIATAESQVRDAQEQLRVTQQGATDAEIVQAQASVDQQRANLQK